MNQIRKIDVAGRTVTADAGVILQSLHEAVAEVGLRFPLTLGGKGSATIGGLVSTNAGGTQVLRHGTMRALVAGIEAVLPNGDVFSGLEPLVKDTRGYDVRHLLCGAEGTLGVVTAATLKLVPAIADRCTAWFGVPSPDAALTILRHLDAALGPQLEGFEILPQRCLDAVLRYMPSSRSPLTGRHEWHILLELVDDRAGDLQDQFERAAYPLLVDGTAQDIAVAKSESESDDWWKLRDSISAAERAAGPALQHDISVPVNLMPAFISANPQRLAARFPGIRCMSFGHLGDGNVHHHVQPPLDCDGAQWIERNGPAVAAIVYDHVAELGGSLSAEHGIGQSKRSELARLSDPARIALLRGVKAGLDPHDLFNPGKLIP